MSEISDRDLEIEAIETCFNALSALDYDSASRALKYIEARLVMGGDEVTGAKETVLSIIQEKPGLRGIEISRRAPHMKERTIRTGLYRLKMDGAIAQRDGGWYPAQSPAQTPEQAKKAKEGAAT